MQEIRWICSYKKEPNTTSNLSLIKSIGGSNKIVYSITL